MAFLADLQRFISDVYKKNTKHFGASCHQDPTLALILDCFGILE